MSLGGRFKDIAYRLARQMCASSLLCSGPNGPPEALVTLRARCFSAHGDKQTGAYSADIK